MKLSVAIFSLLMMAGCASAPVMQPDANVPPMVETYPEEVRFDSAASNNEVSDNPCWGQVKEAAEQAATAVQRKYEEARDSAYVEGAKETAKEVLRKLRDKANRAYGAAKEEISK